MIESGLEALALPEKEIGQVVLVGGGAQLFSIFQTLEKRFAGIDLVIADNPDESVVLGSSLEYGASTNQSRPSLLFIPKDTLEIKGEELVSSSDENRYHLESQDGEIYKLAVGEYQVGRDPSNQIHLVREKLSRFHARIIVSEESVDLADLGSTNGTFVNGNRLETDVPQSLNPGDEIRFGDWHGTISQLPNND